MAGNIYTSDSKAVGPDNPLPTQQTGKKAKVIRTDHGQVLNVAPGAITTITITPSLGELWRIKLLRIYIPAPTGATAGTHQFVVGLYDLGHDGGIINIVSNFGDPIEIRENVAVSATNSKFPTTEQSQQFGILNMVASNDTPIKIWYSNGTTGGTQTGTAIIKIIREVEYIS